MLLDSVSTTTLDDLQTGKKRPSDSETAEYPRRRATIAVCIFTASRLDSC
jgi:hypothetical protein